MSSEWYEVFYGFVTLTAMVNHQKNGHASRFGQPSWRPAFFLGFSYAREALLHAVRVSLPAFKIVGPRGIGAALVQIGRDGEVLAHSTPYGYDGHPIRRSPSR